MPKVSLEENDSIESYEAEEDEIIYHALERQGKKLPHGCLAGSCGSCRILVLEGEDNLKDPGHIESDTTRHLRETYAEKHGEDFLKNKVVRLSCRARLLKGNVTIKPLK